MLVMLFHGAHGGTRASNELTPAFLERDPALEKGFPSNLFPVPSKSLCLIGSTS